MVEDDVPEKLMVPDPGEKVPLLFQSPLMLNSPSPSKVKQLPALMVKSPVIVISVPSAMVIVLHCVPTIKSPG